MWSHYGEKHHGMCLGFDIPREFTCRVKYEGRVQVIGSLLELSQKEQGDMFNRLSWTKYKGWSYEREVRLWGQRWILTLVFTSYPLARLWL